MAADEAASFIGTGTPLSVTVSAGSDRYLVVFVECSTTPTMTRDGQSLTQLHEYNNDGLRYVFGLAAPNTGTADVVVTGGGTISAVTAVVLTDVDQSSPVVAVGNRQWNGASPWTPSAVTSETDGYVIHFGFVTNTTISASAPTELLAEVDTGTYRYFAVGRASAGTLTSTSFTVASTGGTGESILLSLREATVSNDTFTMTQQPTDVTSGAAISPSVVVTSSDNTSSATVTVTKASGTGTLGGTTTAAMSSGVATFSNLVPTGSGSWTLAFDATGHDQQTSSSFTVSSGGGGGSAPGAAQWYLSLIMGG